MPSASREPRADLAVVERLRVHPVDLDRAAVLEARVAQRLDDGQVRVLELDVLADERDPHRRALLRPRRRGATSRSQPLSSGAGGLEAEVLEDEVVDALGAEVRAAPCRCCRRRAPETTASSRQRGEQRDLACRTSCGRPPSERQTTMSGWMPMRRSSLTECCVGLVLSSPAWPMYGTSVRWMNMQRRRPTSTGNWRIASRNGSDSMSPTVPPISVITTSTSCALGDQLDRGA